MTRSLPRTMRAAFAAVLVIVVAWLGGLVWFGATMPQQPQYVITPRVSIKNWPRGNDQKVQPADAIVVLTGGANRLAEGGRLLTLGRAGWLYISGVNIGVKKPELLRITDIKDPLLVGHVVLGYRARNTRQNAEETAGWVKARGFTSIRLVTANYHMRRALLEFRRVLPKTRIDIHPVVPKVFDSDPWWQNMTALSVVIGEYNKYLVALVGASEPLS